jgi:hypothetical protein
MHIHDGNAIKPQKSFFFHAGARAECSTVAENAPIDRGQGIILQCMFLDFSGFWGITKYCMPLAVH